MATNKNRIIAISKKLGLSHIGSCLSVLPILEEIYSVKNAGDVVQLCGAHSHLAHLVVTKPDQAEELIKKDIHCNKESGCDVNGGSLGHGGIALGIALARPDIIVYLVETDGSLNEGSGWEMLRLKKLLKVNNLKIYVNMNGYTAVEKIDREELSARLRAFCPDIDIRYTSNGEGFEGVQGHYKKI